MLGEEVRRGRLARDREALAELVANVCCRNAQNYFGFQPGDLMRDIPANAAESAGASH
jgi:hypothetical protein